jgi:NAD(P)-dependent dehydrogenase (short-subunit alcohol dehydrogenase family)
MGAVATKESKYYPEFERNEVPLLDGKVVAITGCTSGTGFIAAQCAARKGAHTILMLNRPSERATEAEAAVKKQIPTGGTPTVIETIPCDLQDMASVHEAISIIKSKYDKIDVLCNNAGVMALEDVATKDGYDVQMQTNHLSHFLLTKELLPLIRKSTDGRIVNHSSVARKGGPLQGKYFEKNGGNLGGNGSSMILNGARWERYVFLDIKCTMYSVFQLSYIKNFLRITATTKRNWRILALPWH